MKRILKMMLCVVLAFSLCLAFTACGETAEPEATSFTVTVEGGTGGGTYDSGAECTVTSSPSDTQVFYKWTDEIGNQLSTVDPYTFTVTEDITVKAVFETITYTVTVDGIETEYDAGESVTITAESRDNANFVKWVDGSGAELSTSASYTFTVSDDMSVVSVYEQGLIDGKAVIELTNGTISTNSSFRDEVEPGTEVTVTATVTGGGVFIGWKNLITDEIISTEEAYTFTVGESSLSLLAVVNTVQSYTFEGEGINVSSLSCPGFSNSYSGAAMIWGGTDYSALEASNGYFLGAAFDTIDYEFVITSDIAVSGAKLTLRLSSSLGQTVSLDNNVYDVKINGVSYDYAAFDLTASASSVGLYESAFKDYTLSGDGIDLVAGENTITLSILENDFTEGWGGTYDTSSDGGGPGIDCIKIETYATLSWTSRWEINKVALGLA